jgi:hypothetical protein
VLEAAEAAAPVTAAPPAPVGVAAAPPATEGNATLAPDAKPRVPLWRDGVTVGAGVVGVIGVALGSYFGLHAIALDRDAAAGCPGGRCTTGAASTSDRATASADAATGAFALGGVGIAAAAVLLVTRHASTPPVVALVDGHGAYVGWAARF